MIPNIEDQQKGYSIRASLNQVIAWVNDAATYIAGLITDAIAVHDTDGAAHADIRTAMENESTSRQQGDTTTLSAAAQDAASKVATHNTDAATHADIRTLIAQANEAITAGDTATLQSALLALTNAVSAHDIDAAAHADMRALIATINALIPAQAKPGNQLVTKDFMNSSLNAIAAHRLSYNAAGDRFPTKDNLTNATTFYYNGEAFTPTVNDYTVVAADESQDGAEVRYRYTGSQWVIDYIVNDTPFTDAQNKAINSGMTAELTDKLANPDAEPTQNSANLVSSGGVWGWFGAALSSLTTTSKTVIGAINELVTSKVDSATVGGVAVTKSSTTLQLPGYPTSLPANGGKADAINIRDIGFGYGAGLEDLFAVADNQQKGIMVYNASYIQNDPVNPNATDRNIFGACYFINKINDTVSDDWSIVCHPSNYGNNGGYIYTINKTLGVIDRWRRINDNGNAATLGGYSASDFADQDSGTWTPTDEGGSPITSIESKWIRIGNAVLLSAWIDILGTASIRVMGLPFIASLGNSEIISVTAFNSAGVNADAVGLLSYNYCDIHSFSGKVFVRVFIHGIYERNILPDFQPNFNLKK